MIIVLVAVALCTLITAWTMNRATSESASVYYDACVSPGK